MALRKLAILIALAISCITGIILKRVIQNLLQEGNAVQVSRTMATGLQQEITSERNSRPISLPTQHGESRYGDVVHGQDHIIIYNSVPKCGSRTFGDTSRAFFHYRSITYNRYSLRNESRPEKEKARSIGEIRRLIKGAKRPAYVQGHSFFLPFHDQLHINPQPVYINFIRDPVSRMVSAFYYNRFGDGHLKGGYLISEKKNTKSIEECILDRRDACTKEFMYQIFCGFNPRCGEDATWALEQAKSNIDKYYTFIGITEEYEASLRVLEHLMPDMYNGLTEFYLSQINKTNSITTLSKSVHKKPLSQELNDIATERHAVDYELYNYIYDRHRKLKARFGID